MRTRYLGTDYFSSAAPIETLDFLRCPLPHLPPTYFPNLEELHYCFDDVSVLNISLDIEELPIANSLSKFFADILPQIIDVKAGDFADEESFSESACSGVRSYTIEHTVDIDTSQENDDGVLDVKGETWFETVQFEVPEVDWSFVMQRNELHCQMEDLQIFSETPHVANKLDMPSLEIWQQELSEIQQLVYSVDSLFTEYFIEEKAEVFEDSGFIQGNMGSSHSTFFLLEIDEASLDIVNYTSVMDELTSFENIEFQTRAQGDEEINNHKELLGCKEYDLLVHLSDHCLALQSSEVEVQCSNFFAEIDFIGDTVDSEVEQMLLLHQGKSHDISIVSRSIILFEEFQFIDLELYNFCEFFSDIATVVEVQACKQMFGEAMTFRSFNELIVSYELILMDDSFKSLPVPIFVDHQKTRSFDLFVEESLAEVELESSSMFDGLYLDWHVLEEDNSNPNRYSSCWKMLEEIDSYSIDSPLNVFDCGVLLFNFFLSEGSPDKPTSGESNEKLYVPSLGFSIPPISHNEVATGKLLNDDQTKRVNEEISSAIGGERVYVSVESMERENDFDFLLNPHECNRGIKSKQSEWSIRSNKAFAVGSSGNLVADFATSEVSLRQWDVKMHAIKLSEEILGIIDSFKRSFLAILENHKELMEAEYPYQFHGDISLLRIPKEKLIHHIKISSQVRSHLAHDEENTMSLVALCAIKQMSWYLCYYGFHSTYLYIDNLFRSLQGLKYRLSFLQSLVKDICGKAEKDILKFHPSLSVIKELLQSNISKNGKKLLIVAERVFWWPLKRLLASMKISYNEPQNFCNNACQQDECNDFADSINIMFHSDCCLVSHEYITASFPFDKFGIILEYGGAYELSRVSTICPELDKFPLVYFLKVELEDTGVPKALCDGIDMPKIARSTEGGDSHLVLGMKESKDKVDELLNFMPVEENNNRGPKEVADEDEARSMMPDPSVLLATKSKLFDRNNPSFPDTVIIVNTQNCDKETVISRRSTYQKILAMEKEGAQVVERDLNLPVDVLVNAAVSLAWYDLKNIGKKASTSDEAFSSLPLCIENIAANILTSLSFAFSCCILVFEGEKSFLAGVMESSDELYAAAASLGIDLQIFCSYSSEMTDEIILFCIEAATNSIRGVYPRIPESESLAESFLAAFPSINPLSAHAILSSGGILVEFLEWSHERRIEAVQKYNIPDETIGLLSLLSKYGEREDSKSGMTDSSSSVSYAPDIHNFQFKSYSDERTSTYDQHLGRIDMCANGFHFDSDCRSYPPRAAGPNWMSENLETIDEQGKSARSLDHKLFGQSEVLDANMMTNTVKISPLYDFQMAEGSLMSEAIKKPKIPWHDMHSGGEQRLDIAARNKLNRQNYQKSGIQLEDLVGEVIDFDDSTRWRKDIFQAKSETYEVERDSKAGNSGTPRKLSFGSVKLPMFPTSAETKPDSDSWFSISNHQNASRKGNMHNSDSDFINNKIPLKHQKGRLYDGIVQKIASNSSDLPWKEKDNVHHGGTPLWNAVHSSESLRESPWTIEFLNRIKEKSKLHEQSVLCGLSGPCFGDSGNISKAAKRKSPSILEFYKYQGDSVENRRINQKRQKRSAQPLSSSKNKKAKASIGPTWTPDDKRAKQTLSFATSGNGAQSKLIWSDKNSRTMSRRIVHQM